MYLEQTPNPQGVEEPDSPERAPESGEPSERCPVSRDPNVGAVVGEDVGLAPESGSRSDLSHYPAGGSAWKSSDWEPRATEISPPKAPSAWMTAALGVAGLALTAGVISAVLSRRRQYEFTDKTIVITGGSRGLGLVLARQLAREGARLVLLARDEEELRRARDELCELGAEVLAIPCDITVREEVESAIEQAAHRFNGIDVLINNAGIIQVGPMQHMRIEDFEAAMRVHLWGPLYVTLAALPWLRRAGEARIVNISSIGGKVAVPHMMPYVTSKFALTGLSDALRAELRQDNIFVTTVCPNLMRTGSPPNVAVKGRHQEEYAWFAISDSLPLLSIKAERAAHRIIEACRRGAPRLILGTPAKAAVMLNEVAPGLTARLLALANRLLPASLPGGSPESRTGWESESRWAPSKLTRPTYRAAERNNETGPE